MRQKEKEANVNVGLSLLTQLPLLPDMLSSSLQQLIIIHMLSLRVVLYKHYCGIILLKSIMTSR